MKISRKTSIFRRVLILRRADIYNYLTLQPRLLICKSQINFVQVKLDLRKRTWKWRVQFYYNRSLPRALLWKFSGQIFYRAPWTTASAIYVTSSTNTLFHLLVDHESSDQAISCNNRNLQANFGEICKILNNNSSCQILYLPVCKWFYILRK